MFFRHRGILTWAFAVFFTALSVAHDALHCLPGCGHGVLVQGRLVYIGLRKSDAALFSPRHELAVGRPKGQPLLILAEGQCPICSHFSLSQAPTTGVLFILDSPLIQDLPVSGDPSFRLPGVAAFQSRAPPLT